MKERTKSTLKLLLIVVTCGIWLFLIIKIVEYAEYVPFINQYTNTCSPNPAGIYENDIYHHTLPRCFKYIESKYRDKNVLKGLDFLVKVDINSLGFRNDEYPLEKDEDQIRVVLLGDSFTYGYGLNLEDTFFKILEQELNKNYEKKIEVWNIAVVSWGTVIQYLVTKNKLLDYSPDLVILMFDDTDFYDNIIYEEYGIFENGNIVASQGRVDEFFEKRSALVNEARVAYKNDQAKAKQLISKNHAVALKYLQEIARLLDENDIPFLVVFYPYPDAEEEYEKEVLQPFFQNLKEGDIAYYSLYGYFSDEQKKEYYFEGNRHWNKIGSEYVASILDEYIQQNYSEIFE